MTGRLSFRSRSWRALRWIGLALAAPALWACNGHSLEAPEPIPSVITTGTFQETLNRKIDILFMIDDSSSMDTAQANLKANLPAFMDVLKNIKDGLPDVHIAVVTSDMGTGTDVSKCGGNGDGGVFRFNPGVGCTATNLDAGATYISANGGLNARANFTGDITSVFQCIATVGTEGCGFEHQLASVARALGADGREPPQENQGFLRPEAFLGIVLVTNEDDCSGPAGSLIYAPDGTLSSTYGPFGNFVCNEWGHLCSVNGGPLAKPSRFAPNNATTDRVTYDSCVSAEGKGVLTPVGSGGYADWIKSLKADPTNQILVATISGPASPYSVIWKDAPVADTGPWPQIDHSCGSEGAPTSFADPGVRLKDFVEQFGANGLVYPFCSTDYSPALITIAEKLTQFLKPKCITGSIATRRDSTTPDCTVTDVVPGDTTPVQTVVAPCADNGNVAPCWELTIPADADKCDPGSHLVTVNRGGAVPPDNLRDVVQCSMCVGGAPPDAARTCVP